MIKATVINKKLETVVVIGIYFDTLRSDICLNTYYPALHAMQFDARHFRYEAKHSNKKIAFTIMSFINNVAKNSDNCFIKSKTGLIRLLYSINYHYIFKKNFDDHRFRHWDSLSILNRV